MGVYCQLFAEIIGAFIINKKLQKLMISDIFNHNRIYCCNLYLFCNWNATSGFGTFQPEGCQCHQELLAGCPRLQLSRFENRRSSKSSEFVPEMLFEFVRWQRTWPESEGLRGVQVKIFCFFSASTVLSNFHIMCPRVVHGPSADLKELSMATCRLLFKDVFLRSYFT